MKVTQGQKIPNLYEDGGLHSRNISFCSLFTYHMAKRIIYLLLFSKARWLIVSNLFFQIINPALIDPVFASTNYSQLTYTEIRYSRHCDPGEQSQTLASPDKCVIPYLKEVVRYDPSPLLRDVGGISNFASLSLTGISPSPIHLTRKSPESESSLLNNKKRKKPNSSRKSSACVQKDIEVLMAELLRNLPSYANRASQRGRRLSRTTQTYSYMLMAGKPEFAPLPTNPIKNTENTSKKSQDKDVKQVFFTTLERQYIQGKPIHSQQFHRLFLTKTKDGWQMVMMFTQTGSYPKSKPPTPPRDSSNGVVGQAIKTWLRDCRVSENRSRKS